MIFQDRREAGQQLAEALAHYRDRQPVVLAIPRGGVVVGYEVAKALGAPLDVVIPRKLRAPYNPELAIGAVAHDGSVFLDSPLVSHLDVTDEYLREETARQLEEIRRRMQLYRGDRPAPVLEGTTSIIVDDGIATGSTMVAALRATRAARPAGLVAAIPVAPAEGVAMLRREADDVICLHTPPMFYAVGQFYMDFAQTDDEEVIALLRQRDEATEAH
ncbi:MAG: phosphoribosyltransferase [Armatimonadetes bacterium]|nr:phosphoribosyltransferase [Armatimonadota bacterium]MBI2201140.1 phosphoribosyltransferase [Armatimonadota bacterium]MBI2247390.1 phosphoribosyltransferase [Armatimonadota bacterium]MBI2973926.1 phosphoribosyltransferase [Armatimonadota bacterium]